MATWKRILVEGDAEGINGNPVVVTTGVPISVSLKDPDSAEGGGALGSLSSTTVDAVNDVALVWDADADVWKQMPVDQFIVNMAYDELVISQSRFHTLNYDAGWGIKDQANNEILSVTSGENGNPLDTGVLAGYWLKTKWLRIPDDSSPEKEISFLAPTGNYTQTQVYQLPAAYPSSNGQVLSSTTSGVMSWTSNGGGGGGGGSDSFNTISVPGQTDIVADNGNDTLNITAGNGIALTTTPASDTLSIAVNATTTEIPEGTRLYYTDARVNTYLSTNLNFSEAPVVQITGNTNLTDTHANRFLECTNGGAITLSITAGIRRSAEIVVMQANTGAVTIEAGQGVTLRNTTPFTNLTAEQYALIGLKQLGDTDVWVITGERKLA